MITGANIAFLALAILALGIFVSIFWKTTVLDFVKANLGMFTLLLIFLVLLSISFYVFHAASSNSLSKDFLAWLEQKAGEVLASIMTLVISSKNTNQRAGDTGNGSGSGNGNGSSSSTNTSTSTSTKSSSTGLGTLTGTPH